MKKLEGTQTEKNLQAAFAGESQAHTKYAYYASVAKKEGWTSFADLFLETSKNEDEHAELWFKYLHGGSVPDTATNITDAATGEHYENTEMYPEFAKVAREEGFPEIAAKFELVSAVEARHEKRYKQMLESLKRLHDLPGDFHVLPGHEDMSTLAEERSQNPYIRQALAR